MSDITRTITQRIHDFQSAQGARVLSKRHQQILLIALVGLMLVFPYLPFVSNYWIDVGFYVGIYVLLGLSLNIVLGEVGLFNLGQAGFYAIGAYTTGILYTQLHIPIVLLLPISALVAGGFAYLVTARIIHLKGDYLCIVTIGIGEIIRIVANNNPFGLTNGPNGITGIGNPDFGLFSITTPTQFFYYVWFIVALVIVGLINLQKSRIGRAWNYIREDETAAEANGIDVRHYKLIAFLIGTALAGVAGNVYGSKMMIISPDNFTFMESCLIFVIVLLGGLFEFRQRSGRSHHRCFPGNLQAVRQLPAAVRRGPRSDDGVPARRHLASPTRKGRVGGLGIANLPADENQYIEDVVAAGGRLAATAATAPAGAAAAAHPAAEKRKGPETQQVTIQFGGLVAVNRFDPRLGRRDHPDWPKRRGQDHLVQRHHRHLPPAKGRIIFMGEDITASNRTGSSRKASPAPSRTSACSHP